MDVAGDASDLDEISKTPELANCPSEEPQKSADVPKEGRKSTEVDKTGSRGSYQRSKAESGRPSGYAGKPRFYSR